MARYKIGDRLVMSNAGLENYGEKWLAVELIVTHVATNYMPAKEFYEKGNPNGYHPGYDEGVAPQGLYDLKRADNQEELGMSLYDWELVR